MQAVFYHRNTYMWETRKMSNRFSQCIRWFYQWHSTPNIDSTCYCTWRQFNNAHKRDDFFLESVGGRLANLI